MAWANSTIYLPDTDDARAVLLADPLLSGHLFALDPSLVPHPPLPIVPRPAGQPGAGRLLVLRSPWRTRDHPAPAEPLDLSRLSGDLDPRLAALRPALSGDNLRLFPPDAALSWLEDLAARSAGPVFWYLASSMQGDPDAELGLMLDAGAPVSHGSGAEAISIERGVNLYFRERWSFARASGAPGWRRSPARNPLTMGLLHLGLWLDAPWFAPHSPGFDWTALRLSPGAETS